jgi:hypothetical protein
MARLFTIDLFLPRLADQLTDRGHPWSFFNLSNKRTAPARRKNQTSSFAIKANDKGPSARQGFRRGIWQRITASDTAFLPLVDPSDLSDLLWLSSRWVRQRLGLKSPGRGAPESKTYGLSEVGGT